MEKILKQVNVKNLPIMLGPSVGILLGSVIGGFLKPSVETMVILRNAAAGLVLAAVSTELIPEIADVDGYKHRIAVMAGLVIGLGMMLLLRTFFSQKNEDKMSIEVVTSIAIDFFIDAMLIGIALGTGSGTSSFIMAVSLGVEMFILSMTTISQMHAAKSSIGYMIMVSGIFVVASVVGLVGGMFLAQRLKGAAGFYGLLSFGVAALVWLVTEDLLTKSKYVDTRVGATFLFLGFATAIAMGWFGHAH